MQSGAKEELDTAKVISNLVEAFSKRVALESKSGLRKPTAEDSFARPFRGPDVPEGRSNSEVRAPNFASQLSGGPPKPLDATFRTRPSHQAPPAQAEQAVSSALACRFLTEKPN